MAFTRRVAGNIVEEDDPNQYAEAWEGDAGAGEAFQCVEVDDAAKYAGDFRNKDAANSLGLRVRNQLNEILMQAVKDELTFGKNATCLAGVTLDGVDVGSHTHTGAAGHGPTIDHTDLTTIGTNTHAQIDTHIALGSILAFGAVWWPFTIGGSDGHRPVNPSTLVADEDWHILNGETVGGVVLPDYASKFPVMVGAGYALNAEGGAATSNLAHTHAVSGNTGYVGDHRHELTGNWNSFEAGLNTIFDVDSKWTSEAGTHRHAVSITSGSTGSATEENRPPYKAGYWICKIA